MHQTRNETTTKIPIQRKGTKYVARALFNPDASVPALVAIRDMLKLARTAKEVNQLRKEKLIKVNGRTVVDARDPVQLFSILTVGDKSYRLSILPTNKFTFEETKETSQRLCKVTGKRLVNGGKTQLTLHDGSSVIAKNDIAVDDSLYLDNSQKIVKHVALKSGVTAFIMSGRYVGKQGKISAVADKTVTIKVDDKEVTLPSSNVVAQ